MRVDDNLQQWNKFLQGGRGDNPGLSRKHVEGRLSHGGHMGAIWVLTIWVLDHRTVRHW